MACRLIQRKDWSSGCRQSPRHSPPEKGRADDRLGEHPMIDVFVVPEFADQSVAVAGTSAAERFVLSTKFGSFYSIVLKAQGGADEIPQFTLWGSAVLDMGDGNDKVQ